jgi:hypothetical protein
MPAKKKAPAKKKSPSKKDGSNYKAPKKKAGPTSHMTPRTRAFTGEEKRLSKALGVGKGSVSRAASERAGQASKKGAYMTKKGGKIKNVKTEVKKAAAKKRAAKKKAAKGKK